MRLSYSMLLNYLQCPLRIVLLQQNPQQFLFPEQFVGLYVHEYIEQKIGMAYGLEGDLNKDRIVQQCLHYKDTPRLLIGDLSIYLEALSRWEPMLDTWAEQCLEVLHKDLIQSVDIERRMLVTYKGMELVAMADIVGYTADGTAIIYDLKRSSVKDKYDVKQLALYSWVVKQTMNIPVHKLRFLFLTSSGVGVTEYDLRVDDQSALLDWMLKKLYTIGVALENGLTEYFPANTLHYTCAPYRCGKWNECPYGKLATDLETLDTGGFSDYAEEDTGHRIGAYALSQDEAGFYLSTEQEVFCE